MASVTSAPQIKDAQTRSRVLTQCLARCERALETNPSHAPTKELKSWLDDKKADGGWTFAHVAAARGDVGWLQELAKADGSQAALRSPDIFERTPFDLACLNGHLACRDFLAARGTDTLSAR